MKRNIIFFLVICLNVFSGFSQSLWPDFSDDGNNYSQSLISYGQRVAVWENTAVVTFPNNAAAYIYEFDGTTWQKIATLRPSTPDNFARFGYGADIYDSIIVIGAPKENDSKGAAYVYIRPSGGWKDTTESFKLLPNITSTFPSYFGQSVLVHDSLIFIGAPYEDSVGAMNGCVYMYNLEIGPSDTIITLFKKLVPDVTATDALEFGWSMDLEDKVLVVGSNSTQIPGYVHVFMASASGWQDVLLLAKLGLPDGQVQEYVGYSVKIQGNYIMAGSPGWDNDSADVGRVAVFYSSDGRWDDYQTAVINCPVEDRGLGFGASLFFSDDALVVGIPGYDGQNADIGAIDVIPVPSGGSWLDSITEHNIWQDPYGYEDMRYGTSMTKSDNFLIIGAPKSNTANESLGKVYFYYLPVIYHHPDDQINACTYENIKFHTGVLGPATFQWYQSTDNGQTFTALSDNTEFNGTDSSVLVVTSSTVADSSLFRCVVTGSLVTRKSDSARLVWDKIKPYVTVDTITVYLDSTGRATITGEEFGPADNCSVRDWFLTESTFGCGQSFVQDTIIVRDNCGNIDTIPVFVIVEDTIKPSITWLQSEYDRYLDSTGRAAVGSLSFDLYDNCKIADIHYAFDTVECSMRPLVEDTLFVSDEYGNSTQSPFKINVYDTIAPFLSVFSRVDLYLDSLGQAALDSSVVIDSAWDNCSVVDTFIAKIDFDCSDLGQLLVKVGIQDEAGLLTSQELNVRVFDTIKPYLSVFSQINLYLDSSGTAVLSPDLAVDSAWDNCSLIDTAVSPSSFDCSTAGDNTVEVTVTDIAGLTDSKNLTVSVSDTIKPFLVVPSRVLVYLDSSGRAVLTPSMAVDSAWDNCGLSDTSLSRTEFECLSYGRHSVKVKITDVSSLQDSSELTVFVLDTIKPYMTVVDMFTIFIGSDGTYALHPGQLIDSLWDNCIIADTSLSQSLFTCDDLGFKTITVTATDLSGNSVTKQVYLEIADTTSPVVTCSPGTFYLDSSGSVLVWPENLIEEINDNCSLGSIGISQHKFDCSNLGDNDVTVFADDRVGNIGECSTFVTIEDTIKPYLALVPDLTVYLDTSGVANITPEQLIDSVWDNCGIADTSVSQLVFSCQNLGANDVIVTVTDVSGLTVQKSIIVYVADTILPVLRVTEADTVYLDESGQGMWDTAGVIEYAWDNCSAELAVDVPVYSCADLGTDTVTFVLSDQSGNIASARTVVYVLDTLKPVLTCAGEIVRTADASGVYVVQGDEFDPQVTENCGYVLTNSYNDSLTLDGSVFNPDTIEIVWSVTDQAGNTDTCQSVVVIREQINTGVLARQPVIRVYPNPAGDKLTVELPVDVEKVKLEVWSVEGKKIMTLPAAANTVSINISDLPAGAYVLRFIADGQVRAVYFVKK